MLRRKGYKGSEEALKQAWLLRVNIEQSAPPSSTEFIKRLESAVRKFEISPGGVRLIDSGFTEGDDEDFQYRAEAEFTLQVTLRELLTDRPQVLTGELQITELKLVAAEMLKVLVAERDKYIAEQLRHR